MKPPSHACAKASPERDGRAIHQPTDDAGDGKVEEKTFLRNIGCNNSDGHDPGFRVHPLETSSLQEADGFSFPIGFGRC